MRNRGLPRGSYDSLRAVPSELSAGHLRTIIILIMKKFLTLLAGASLLAVTALAGEFPDISIAELQASIKEKKVTVIDVNGTESFKAGHVPGAVDFEATPDIAKVLPADKKALIVAYCGGPTCNAYTEAAEAAQKLGYTNVKHLSAGISGWKDAKAAIEK